MSISSSPIGVIGAGAWGTALAQVWARHGTRVILWARQAEEAQRINSAHVARHLPEVTLDAAITATSDMADLAPCTTVVYALPAQVLRPHLTAYPPLPHQVLVIAAKGIERESGKLLSAVVHEVAPDTRVAILSGPNFAREVAVGLPAASTIACADQAVLQALQAQLSTRNFRLYPSFDLIGAQCGGALKNVIAIACGIVDGLKLGDNARAALITRGLAEVARLTTALGGTRETLMGLCGMGDLILSCTSAQSRNYRFGLALADGAPHDLTTTTTVEGVPTAQAAVEMVGVHHLEMPICVAVAACVNGQMSVQQAVDALLQRPARQTESE